MELLCDHVSKSFHNKKILKDITFNLTSGEKLVLFGRNGSGKTTLSKCLCGLIKPTSGNIIIREKTKEISGKKLSRISFFISPYMNLYDELTAWDNILFFIQARGITDNADQINELLAASNLKGREFDQVSSYSSGMKVRVKYIIAALLNSDLLIVDEPFTNLDQAGKIWVKTIINDFYKQKMVIWATNDKQDMKIADKVIELGNEY